MTIDPTIKESFKAGWLNGSKPLIIAAGVFFMSVAVLLAAFMAYLVGVRVTEGNPLRYPVPQQIIVQAGPLVFSPGDTLTILGTKCNTSEHAVQVNGTSYWERQDTNSPEVPFHSGSRVLEPSCETRVFFNDIPDLTPGFWRLEGQDCTASHKCAAWYTDTFEVRP